MFPATEELMQAFEDEKLVFHVQESEESSRLTANAIVDYTSFTAHFISSDDRNDVSVRVPHFVRFKEKDVPEMLRVANLMNERFRFCKFVVNPESEAITLEYDFPENTEQIGQAGVELFRRLMQIAEEAYPEFMKAIWNRPPEVSLGNIQFHDFTV